MSGMDVLKYGALGIKNVEHPAWSIQHGVRSTQYAVRSKYAVRK